MLGGGETGEVVDGVVEVGVSVESRNRSARRGVEVKREREEADLGGLSRSPPLGC